MSLPPATHLPAWYPLIIVVSLLYYLSLLLLVVALVRALVQRRWPHRSRLVLVAVVAVVACATAVMTGMWLVRQGG